jgi:hypothetical protein
MGEKQLKEKLREFRKSKKERENTEKRMEEPYRLQDQLEKERRESVEMIVSSVEE